MNTYEFKFIVVCMGETMEDALLEAYDLLPQIGPDTHMLLEIDGAPISNPVEEDYVG